MALPSIGRGLNADIASLQWIVDAYALAFAALMLAGGGRVDRLGPRRVYLGGLLGFAIASAACAAAPGTGALLAARVAQGIAAALVLPGSLALIRHAVPDAETRTRAVGLWTVTGAIAGVSGLALGGLLVTASGWRAVFAVDVPLAALGAWLTWRGARGSGAVRNTRVAGITGQLLATGAMLGATAAIIESRRGLHASVIAGFATLVVAGAAFVVHERHASRPVLPPGVLRHPSVRAASIVGFLVSVDGIGIMFIVGLHLQFDRGFGPLAAGLAIVPQPALTWATSWALRRAPRVPPPQQSMTAGLLLSIVGCFGLFALAHPPYAWIALMQAMLGAGAGLCIGPMNDIVLSAVSEAESGLAAGLLNAVRQIGIVLAIAVFGALAGAAGDLATGVQLSSLAAAGLTMLGIVLLRRITAPAAQSLRG